MCGEKPSRLRCAASAAGSPPRVRGEGRESDFGVDFRGITPACAGRRCCGSIRGRPSPDHPRVCGEKFSPRHVLLGHQGSPPRVRGEVRGHGRRHGDAGITPACAGRSTSPFKRVWMRKDHPRVCGEKSIISMSSMRFSGSPPRVRGEEDGAYSYLGPTGITPACAGRRTMTDFDLICEQDHPRVCGEKMPWLPL